jgi:hypothetical protein
VVAGVVVAGFAPAFAVPAGFVVPGLAVRLAVPAVPFAAAVVLVWVVALFAAVDAADTFAVVTGAGAGITGVSSPMARPSRIRW